MNQVIFPANEIAKLGRNAWISFILRLDSQCAQLPEDCRYFHGDRHFAMQCSAGELECQWVESFDATSKLTTAEAILRTCKTIEAKLHRMKDWAIANIDQDKSNSYFKMLSHLGYQFRQETDTASNSIVQGTKHIVSSLTGEIGRWSTQDTIPVHYRVFDTVTDFMHAEFERRPLADDAPSSEFSLHLHKFAKTHLI